MNYRKGCVVIAFNLLWLESWIRKKKPRTPMQILTKHSEAVITLITPEIKEVIRSYFRAFDSFISARDYQTDTFIKEVFYATTQEQAGNKTISEMESRVYESNKARLRLKAYEIDEFDRLGSNSVIIGVTREFSGGYRNRVIYILQKLDGSWKFHHVVRSHTGRILETFNLSQKAGYVIGNKEQAMLFLTPKNSPESVFQIGDYVHVEGYLEVDETLGGEFFHQIFRMNRIQ